MNQFTNQFARSLTFTGRTFAVGLLACTISSGARADVRRGDFRIDADLAEAAMNGESARVRTLLGQGAKVDERDPQTTWTPLMWAARGGHVATIRVLLGRGANVNAASLGNARVYFSMAQREPGRTRVVRAASPGAPSTSGALDSEVPEPSVFRTSNRNVTPLLLASAGGFNLAARELLKRGARVNARTSSGETALEAAAFRGYLPLVETLLARGAEVNSRNGRSETPLIVAIKEGHSPVVKRLLAAGADPGAQTSNGYSAIVLAKYFGFKDIERLLSRAQATRPPRLSNGLKAKTVAPRPGSSRPVASGKRVGGKRAGAPAARGPGILILN